MGKTPIALLAVTALVFAQDDSSNVRAAVSTGEGILVSVPLEPPPAHDGNEPLFRQLDPDDTGLAGFENDFRSPHIWGKHWRTYLFGAIGTGVAIGDVDSDGLPDIFAVSKNERSRLFRNLGGFKFEDITGASGIDEAVASGIDKNETPGGGAAFADVNNDGYLDLYLCYLGAANQLWINDGTGHFEERAALWGVDTSTASVLGSFADYDADGLLDLYLATNLLQEGDDYPGPRPDHLFRNEGTRFSETTATAGIAGKGHAHSAVWWDYNRDGRMDIYVANDFTEADRLYRNRGDGTFENVIAQASPRAPFYGMGADFGDINHDGFEDFWVADMTPTSRARYKQTLESHRHVYAGQPDNHPNQYMQNVLLLNLSGERFADIAALAGLHRTNWTWAPRLVDLDNDGWLDAFATNGMLRNFNDGDLGMRLRGQNSLRYYARIFRPTPVLKEANLAYRNTGGLRFEEVGARWGLDKIGVSFGAALGDLNRDGGLDLVLSNYGEPPSIHQNLESSAGRVVIELRGRQSNHYGVGSRVELSAGGFRQVKTLMPQRGYMSSDEPILHFGLGGAEWIDRLVIRWPSGRIQHLEGLAANHRYVIEEVGEIPSPPPRSTPRFRRFAARFPATTSRRDPGADEFRQQPLLPFARSRLMGAATAADLNGDHRADLILGGPSGQGTTVLLGGENFVFEEVWSLDLDEDFPSTDASFALGDFNGDGALDLMAASGGTSLDIGDPGLEDRLYLGDGNGGFARDFDSVLSSVAASTGAVAAGDHDTDGHLDIFIGAGAVPGSYPKSDRSELWRGLPGGGFERVAEDRAPGLSETGLVTAAIWADLENDGHPELLVLSEWASPQLWRNHDGRLVLDRGALGGAERAGLWTSIAVGDFDGDGRLDVAAGNLGLNTGGLWEPSLGPRRLWWRADEREVRLIETHLEGDVEWPLAWWDRLKDTIKGGDINARTYTSFAEKTAAELLGELPGQGFKCLEISDAQSGVFWQQPDGRFAFEPLPDFAQSGRIVAMVAADIDRDGLLDLVASIEPPSLAPWTGRTEQGHVACLLGRRDRQWQLELPWATGLDVEANSPRQLLWADFDGDAVNEMMVVLAEGEPLVFTPSR